MPRSRPNPNPDCRIRAKIATVRAGHQDASPPKESVSIAEMRSELSKAPTSLPSASRRSWQKAAPPAVTPTPTTPLYERIAAACAQGTERRSAILPRVSFSKPVMLLQVHLLPLWFQMPFPRRFQSSRNQNLFTTSRLFLNGVCFCRSSCLPQLPLLWSSKLLLLLLLLSPMRLLRR